MIRIYLRRRPNNRRKTGTRKRGGRITVIFISLHAFLRRSSPRQIPLLQVYAADSFAFRLLSLPLGIFSDLLQNSTVVRMSGGRNCSCVHFFQNGTALFFGMHAFGIPAVTHTGYKFPKSIGQILRCNGKMPSKIQHGKAGRICNKAICLSASHRI